jgi:peptidoglycan/LPS O-acetylase OafA/YrhL
VAASSGFTPRVPPGELAGAIGAWLIFTYPAAADLNGFAGSGRLIAYAAWSLPYEVLFYAVLPLAAMLRFRALRPRAALACLLLLGAMLLLAGGRPPFRLPVLASFAGGVVAAHAARSAAVRRWGRGSLAGLLALACLAAALTGFRTAFTPAVTLLLTGFFTVVACGNSLRGALDRPAALWLGQASYSLYLQHGLVL